MTSSSPQFEGWPKIPRYKGSMPVIVTEKIDGTNAAILIENSTLVAVQSRNQFITPEKDNFGFAAWVYDNAPELVTLLGDGRHFGEWAGPGIQKNPHKLDEKTFFLFNTSRWAVPEVDFGDLNVTTPDILYTGPFSDDAITRVMNTLANTAYEKGYTPEGIVLYFPDGKSNMKATFANPEGKWTV